MGGDMMKPAIVSTGFGYITVGDTEIEHDIVIRLSGRIKKRKKRLSKSIYGTSHTISLDEAKYVYEDGAKHLIVGSGQQGMVKLSDEAAAFFKEAGCKVDLLPTPKAIKRWNEAEDAVIGLFHVTC
jgi:hypothetical protein